MQMRQMPFPGEYLIAYVPRPGATYIDCTIDTVYLVVEVLLGRRTVSPLQLKRIWRICGRSYGRLNIRWHARAHAYQACRCGVLGNPSGPQQFVLVDRNSPER